MSLKDFSEIREVSGISPVQLTDIMNFLQGAVYCWCKNRPEEWFSIRDLMGGDNFFWDGTPLYCLYKKHENISSDPIDAAGKDSGWILKKVIHEDKRKYDSRRDALIRQYLWIPKAELENIEL
jgi:hypothetical protein